jgi:hypothetical protein
LSSKVIWQSTLGRVVGRVVGKFVDVGVLSVVGKFVDVGYVGPNCGQFGSQIFALSFKTNPFVHDVISCVDTCGLGLILQFT